MVRYNPHLDRVDVALRALHRLYVRDRVDLLARLDAPTPDEMREMCAGRLPRVRLFGPALQRVLPLLRDYPGAITVAGRMLGLYYDRCEASRLAYYRDTLTTDQTRSTTGSTAQGTNAATNTSTNTSTKATAWWFLIPYASDRVAGQVRAWGAPARAQVLATGEEVVCVILPAGVTPDMLPVLDGYHPHTTDDLRVTLVGGETGEEREETGEETGEEMRNDQ